MKKYLFILLLSCNPQPNDSATESEPVPTTTSTCMNKTCILAADCLGTEICDFDHIYSDISTCLQVCNPNNPSDCFGHPEKCIKYNNENFICKPNCEIL